MGGIELDRRMREVLIDAFNAETGKDKREDKREDKRDMVKLWKEAVRVKALLSANNEAMAIVESEMDFKTRVARAQFAEKCKDLKSEFAKPIGDLLKNAGLTLDNLIPSSSWEEAPGSLWPKQPSKLRLDSTSPSKLVLLSLTTLLSDKIALNVNAVEAAVLWAALYGASLEAIQDSGHQGQRY